MANTTEQVLSIYPAAAQEKIRVLRRLVIRVASEQNFGEVIEAIKWGELSFSVKSGSPFRMAWKAKTPTNFHLYFHCQTKLIDTFRVLFPDDLQFEGNRAIVLKLEEEIPTEVLYRCIAIAMNYKNLKHLPLLGQ
ncbi:MULTISPECIES: DUF1801 domain-containing protein [Pseudoalteromonas]|uniref:DUF1801 domain-containing protein n=1 Tax=Pseudoalteromonas TaxID=53246 RepID=UPI000FFF074C|nr:MULTISPECIES: DUF1801 domain-containing protein [Pseudoalteromonas]MCG9759256.1 DUF1801 domain-containing protein [Pseudoalteromonas sp. Isolate6]NKC21501.1 DUF1801 domain-containing protein [Pseudoalteromonas galatheae]RXE87620.1 DUF1801 domain-containing protein [Pseudoalteromonas sp. A757]